MAAIAALPLGQEVRLGIVDWLFRQDPWLGAIAEFQPLYREGWLHSAMDKWGVLGPLAILLVPLGLFTLWRRDPRRGLAFALWTVVLAGLAVLQVRFGRLFCVNLALASAFALEAVAVRAGLPGAQLWLAVGLILLDPRLRSVLQWSRPEPLPYLAEALLPLRDLPGGEKPGVLAPWDVGHEVLWFAERPVVTTGFGTYLDPAGFEEERRAWTLPEDDLVAWMDRRKLGVVLAGASVYFDVVGPQGGHLFAMEGKMARLNPGFLLKHPLAVSAVAGSGIADASVPHLRRFAPLIATTPAVEGFGLEVPAAWVLERVPGASLVGVAAPGERVVAQTTIQTNQGIIRWEGWTDADIEGVFVLVDPIANDTLGFGFETGALTMVRRRAGMVEVVVPAHAVRQGQTLQVPSVSASSIEGNPSP
jgi:hypothetical protein